MKIVLRAIGFVGILSLLAAGAGCSQQSHSTPLSGRVQSPEVESLAGIPVRAHLAGSNRAVTVYTNKQGQFVYRDLLPGLYTVSIEAAGFESLQKEGIALTAGEPVRLDLDLQPRSPSLDELTTAEILMALPGTREQKIKTARCSNCHPLQFALQQRRDRQDWLQIIERMRGITSSGVMRPEKRIQEILHETRDSNNDLADFLASVRGPDSPELPYKLFPRPTEEASTSAVITEYRIPRGAVSVTFRGDQRGAWLHDVMPDPNGRYIWYTDHFKNVLGRLDPESGEIKEFSYPHAALERQQGAHKLLFDKQGNIWLGENWQGTIARFDPRTEQFTQWTNPDSAANHGMFGIDSNGNIWAASSNTNSVSKLDPRSGQFTNYPIPTPRGMYGCDVDSKDFVYYCQMDAGRVGRFDPGTGEFTNGSHPLPIQPLDAWTSTLRIDSGLPSFLAGTSLCSIPLAERFGSGRSPRIPMRHPTMWPLTITTTRSGPMILTTTECSASTCRPSRSRSS